MTTATLTPGQKVKVSIAGKAANVPNDEWVGVVTMDPGTNNVYVTDRWGYDFRVTKTCVTPVPDDTPTTYYQELEAAAAAVNAKVDGRA